MVILPSFAVLLAFLTVGGAIREAKDEEFPFQVSIKTRDMRHICGGAIIAPKWILTASDCLRNQNFVIVSYGSADSNLPANSIGSVRIEHQNDLNVLIKNRLALIELKEAIEFSKTARQAKLPTDKSVIRNTTKLSGWNVNKLVDIPPSLYVTDKYFIIEENCRTQSGAPIHLAIDEFCGIDEESNNHLTTPGTIVSKSSIVLGLLAQGSISPVLPVIFVKVSKHEQWIKDVLGSDAQFVAWVDEIPRDSAVSYVTSLTLLGISAYVAVFNSRS